MEKIRFIKTLPHLQTIFLNNQSVYAYLSNFTLKGLDWLSTLELFNKNVTFRKLLEKLTEFNFTKIDKVSSPAEFSIKGDIISFWPIGYDHPIRVSFFGEEIEEMFVYDEMYGRKIEDIQKFFLGKVEKAVVFQDCHLHVPSTFSDYLKLGLKKIVFLKSFQGIFSLLQIPTEEVISAGERKLFEKVNEVFEIGDFEFLQTDFVFPQLFFIQADLFLSEIERLKKIGYKVFVSEDLELAENFDKLNFQNKISQGSSKNHSRQIFVSEKLTIQIPNALNAGFVSENLKLAYFTDRELNGTIYLGRYERIPKDSNNIGKLLKQFEGNIKIGDIVVHEDYGIAIYKGLKQESIDGEMLEFLELEFDQSDQLFVPIFQIEKISKFVGPEGTKVKLSKLGGASWQNLKKKVATSAGALAKRLLEHYAKLQISETDPIEINDSEEYKKFVEEFPYIATPDQLNSTNEIIADLAKTKPMNRLLVGDVGFGKTEVIMRACFKVVENGGQVLVLSPTTVLTQQHFEVFSKRFQHFPISIGFVSRFKSAKENSTEIEKLNSGKLDILIGTHRLLSNDIRPKRLKLVVVDEEQKFGVKQKEKLRELNYSTHVLSVSATPIPRTLGMALSAIQDLSVISTPPFERKPVKTEIIKENWNKVVEAVKFEVERGGQVFFLHNEVRSIQAIFDKLKGLLPDYKFVIAHGQMSNDELDRSIAEFYNKKYDVLIATSIIENGLDMPNVNTIIIHNADRFGVSQLYQLRGRVGRSDRQAFCYLMYKGDDISLSPDDTFIQKDLGNASEKPTSIIEKAYLKRLRAIVENQELGVGFRVASRDLEIRGAGNLLGKQQSGFISNVGYVLYLQLLGQEVEKLRK